MPNYIEMRDIVATLLVAITVALVYAAASSLGYPGVGIALPVFAGLVAFMQLNIYRRILFFQRQHEAQVGGLERQVAVYFKQTEALANLHTLLNFQAPLPPTRGWAASPDFLSLMSAIVIETPPKTIVELGSGVSTVVLGYLLRNTSGGKVISVENDEEHYMTYKNLLAAHGLDKVVDIRYAPLKNMDVDGRQYLWYDVDVLRDLENIDLLVVDGPPAVLQKHSRYPAFPVLKGAFSDYVTILMDDGNRSDEQEISMQWQEIDDRFVLTRYSELEKGAILLTRPDSTREGRRGECH